MSGLSNAPVAAPASAIGWSADDGCAGHAAGSPPNGGLKCNLRPFIRGELLFCRRNDR